MIFTEDKRKEIGLFSLLLLFAVFFISADAFNGLKVYDEGVTVYGALRVLHGALPFRDFWTVYMPGNFYLYALVFKIFGPSLVVERITSIVLMIGISIMTYLIAKKVLTVSYALVVFFFSNIWFSTFDFFGYILYPTLLLGLISFYFFLSYLKAEKKYALFWAGIFAGGTALFRHDFGFYVFAAEVLVLLLYRMYMGQDPRKEKIQAAFTDALRIIIGTALVFVPVALYFLVEVPFKELYSDLITFPLEVYPDYRGIPFPAPFITYAHFQQEVAQASFSGYIKEHLNRLYLYFPPIVYIALSVQLVIRSYKNKAFLSSKEFWISSAILLIGLLFFTKVIVRSLYLHLMPTYLMAIVVFFMVLANIEKTLNRKKINLAVRVLLYFLAIPAFIRPFWSESVGIKNSDKNYKEQLDVARAAHIRWDVRGKDYEKVITYVDSLVPKRDKIFVGSERHDRIFTNDVMFYFLAERESPTMYYELHPGLATTQEIQEKIVHDIIASRVKLIVLKEETTVETENKSGSSSGVTLLDDFIRRNYRFDKNFGEYSVWIKKDTTNTTYLN